MGCSAPTVIVGGVNLSTSVAENQQALVSLVGGDQGDPTQDEYTSYIANGNNTSGVKGIQFPVTGQTLPTQTTLPTPSPFPAITSDTTPPPNKPTPQTATSTWDGVNYDGPAGTAGQMSKNFTLRVFTIGGGTDAPQNLISGPVFPNPIVDVPGYTAQQRYANLQALSANVLEPLLAKFGPFRLNSVLRNTNTVKPPALSQHYTGQAADIQFPNWAYDTYWANAAWIRDNIPYDKFIFEHSPSHPTVWIHLSFNSAGGRASSDPTKVMTMYRGHYDSGLKKYF